MVKIPFMPANSNVKKSQKTKVSHKQGRKNKHRISKLSSKKDLDKIKKLRKKLKKIVGSWKDAIPPELLNDIKKLISDLKKLEKLLSKTDTFKPTLKKLNFKFFLTVSQMNQSQTINHKDIKQLINFLESILDNKKLQSKPKHDSKNTKLEDLLNNKSQKDEIRTENRHKKSEERKIKNKHTFQITKKKTSKSEKTITHHRSDETIKKDEFRSAKDKNTLINDHLKVQNFSNKANKQIEAETRTLTDVRKLIENNITTIAKSIKSHISENKTELTVKLHPPELGEVKIFLVKEMGEVKARIVFSTEKAFNMFSSKLNDIKQAILSQGINLSSLDIGMDMSSFTGERQTDYREINDPLKLVRKYESLFNEGSNAKESITGISSAQIRHTLNLLI